MGMWRHCRRCWEPGRDRHSEHTLAKAARARLWPHAAPCPWHRLARPARPALPAQLPAGHLPGVPGLESARVPRRLRRRRPDRPRQGVAQVGHRLPGGLPRGGEPVHWPDWRPGRGPRLLGPGRGADRRPPVLHMEQHHASLRPGLQRRLRTRGRLPGVRRGQRHLLRLPPLPRPAPLRLWGPERGAVLLLLHRRHLRLLQVGQ